MTLLPDTQSIARRLEAAGQDTSGLTGINGELFAVQKFDMVQAPPKAKRIDEHIDGTSVQAKAFSRKSFFGQIKSYEAAEYLFI